jgi:hypothetical protein
MKIMSKFKLFLSTGIGFGFDWAINMKTGFNLDDPAVYVTPVLNVLNNTTLGSSSNTYPAYDLQSQITTELTYVTLIIKILPIIPLLAAFTTNDKKGNSNAYLAGIIIGFVITYLII